MIEKDTLCSASHTKAELVAKIKETFKDLPRDTGSGVVLVEAEGGYFEFIIISKTQSS